MEIEVKIWRYHQEIDSKKFSDKEEAIKWINDNWMIAYDDGDCDIDVYEDGNRLTLFEEIDKGYV